MKKIIIFVGSLFLLVTTASAYSEAENKCMDAWSTAFDKIDEGFLETTDKMMQQNQKNTSELTQYFPQIARTYRCHLYDVCTAVASYKDRPSETIDAIKIANFGCRETTIGEVKQAFPAPLENCFFRTDMIVLQGLREACFLHADFKLEQMKIIGSHLLRKDAQRKKMAFLSYKLTDLRNRLETFLSDQVVDFHSKFNKIMTNIHCIVKKCD